MSESLPVRPIGRLLQTPPAVFLKTRVRALWWAARGRGLATPVPRQPVRSFLFVCKGNICRSPLAERLCTRLLHERNMAAVRSASAGIAADPEEPVPTYAKDASRDYGVSLDDHRPTLLTQELIASHDVVVVMEVAQLELMRRRYLAYEDRFVLLSLFQPEAGRPCSGYERFNIADPYGKSRAEFDRCYRYLDAALRELLDACGLEPRGGSVTRRA